MSTAVSKAQPWLAALVDLDTARSGSRMNAYANVARSIGASGSWVRKFLGNQPVRLDADVYLGIQARYEAACARWDAEAEAQKQRFLALGRGADEMDQSKTVRSPVDQSRQPARRRKAASVVAGVVGEGQK